MKLYVVTMQAVYDHGCAGIFSTKDAAMKHADALYEDSDKHHSFRVEEFTLDEPVDLPARDEIGLDLSDPDDVARRNDRREWKSQSSSVFYCERQPV